MGMEAILNGWGSGQWIQSAEGEESVAYDAGTAVGARSIYRAGDTRGNKEGVV